MAYHLHHLRNLRNLWLEIRFLGQKQIFFSVLSVVSLPRFTTTLGELNLLTSSSKTRSLTEFCHFTWAATVTDRRYNPPASNHVFTWAATVTDRRYNPPATIPAISAWPMEQAARSSISPTEMTWHNFWRNSLAPGKPLQ